MNKLQISLDMDTISAIDLMAQIRGMSREQVIQQVLDHATKNYLLSSHRDKKNTSRKKQKNPLLQMGGLFESPSGSVSQNIDEIYVKD